MAGTQGIDGKSRVLFYLGSFETNKATLSGTSIFGKLTDDRCDYYIDKNGKAWMRTGTEVSATGSSDGNSGDSNWKESETVGFLQAGAIHADMINANTFVGSDVIATAVNATEINADNIKSGTISSNVGKSYFNLDTGDFVLGGDDNGGGALSYINGKLHIGGSQTGTDNDIAELLNQIGVLNDKINNIGGKNLLKQTAFHHKYIATDLAGFTKIYNLEAGKTYIATWGKFENNADGATNEFFNDVCLGIGNGNGFINTEQVVKFGEPFYVNENGKILSIIWCDYGYAKHMIGVDDLTGAETKTEFTQYLNQVMLQEGEVATNFQPSVSEEMSEAITPISTEIDSYKYLKSALENDTDIAGGLVASSQIQLRDWTGEYLDDGTTKEYKVIAGISGIKDDNVLLWGGGTYSEAVNAAKDDNDFHKQPDKGDTQITTLIKKDGQGKIGIFKISDTQAIVKTNQGEILIDAADYDGGIFIRNNNGENKISIKNGVLGSDIIPQENSGSGSKLFNFSNVLCSGSSGTCSTQKTADLWTDMLDTYSGGTNTVTVSFENVSFRQMLRYFGTTPTRNTTVKIILYAKSGSSSSQVSTKTLTLQNVTSGSNYVSELTYQNFSLSYTTTRSYTFELGVELNGVDHYACLGDFMMEGNVKWSWSWKPTVVPHTVIGTDGFATIYDSSKYFMIQNTSNGQQIYAKGLKKTKGTSGSGELYVSNTSNEGLLKTLKDAFEKISSVLNIAKYEGSNAATQEAATTAITNVINELDKISIIANS